MLSNLKIIASTRWHKEDVANDFLEDKFRIINSKAFRRLEYKTQVFINYIGDHYRTRLTHSLEVSLVAQYIAKSLGLNQELAEVISLLHDLGHPPFGHGGEHVLNNISSEYGGFNHNYHCIKIITVLEKQFSGFNGLNLTLESIDGVLKHNGIIQESNENYTKLSSLLEDYAIEFGAQGALESQVSAIADDIAYCIHDIDDGIRAFMVKLEDFCDIEAFSLSYQRTKQEFLSLNDDDLLRKEVLRNFRSYLINDVIAQSVHNIKSCNIDSLKEVKSSKEHLIAFSKKVSEDVKELKKILFAKVYRSTHTNRVNFKAQIIIKDLFSHFMNYPNSLPSVSNNNLSDGELAELVVDYIAGMTDRFAVDEHRRIFDLHNNYFYRW